MDEQTNRDPGILNSLINAGERSAGSGDTGNDSVIDRAKNAVGGVFSGSDEHTGDQQGDTDVSDTGHPSGDTANEGNFGSSETIASDNATVQNAARGLDPDKLDSGPANISPDIAQGSTGGS